jgi:hypothetical protein
MLAVRKEEGIGRVELKDAFRKFSERIQPKTKELVKGTRLKGERGFIPVERRGGKGVRC